MAKYILAIDDEEVVRDAFELALARTGYDVETAASGEEGLEKAVARKPDLIFLDLKMPGIDGVETLRRLQDCCAEVPIYIVTAFYQEFFRDLEQAGKDGCLFQVAQKPLNGEQIRLIVKGMLDSPQAFITKDVL